MTFVVKKISTKGDVVRDVALSKIGGKGLFAEANPLRQEAARLPAPFLQLKGANEPFLFS